MPPIESDTGITGGTGIGGIPGIAGAARLRFESARFESAAAEYERWNLQPPSLVEELAARIAGEGDAPHLPVVLSGESGIGRGYLVRAALFLAERRGAQAALAVLDLDGWEPERADLAAYLEHRLRREEHQPDRDAVLQEIVDQGNLAAGLPSAWTAALLSIGVSLQLPAGKLRELLLPGGEEREPREGSRPRPQGALDTLDRTLRELTAARRLVLHVPEAERLTSPLSRFLLDRARTDPRLLLVLSCRPATPTESIARLPGMAGPAGAESERVVRLELAPLDRRALREVVDARFPAVPGGAAPERSDQAPGGFEPGFYEALWRYSLGVPGQLATKLHDLHAAGVLVQGDDGAWRLTTVGEARDEYARAFSAEPFAPLLAAFEAMPRGRRELLWNWLVRAALCGPAVPARPLLAAMGLPVEGVGEPPGDSGDIGGIGEIETIEMMETAEEIEGAEDIETGEEIEHGEEIETGEKIEPGEEIETGEEIEPREEIEPAEEIEDAIDELLVEDPACALFHEARFDHPSFPGVATYELISPLLARLVLERIDPEGRRQVARELLARLPRHLPQPSRGAAALLLSLAEASGEAGSVAAISRQLSWWTGFDDFEALREEIAGDVREGRLRPELLWGVINATRDAWPAFRRLALLDALGAHEGGMPLALAGPYWFLRADAFMDLRERKAAGECYAQAARFFRMRRGAGRPEGAGTPEASAAVEPPEEIEAVEATEAIETDQGIETPEGIEAAEGIATPEMAAVQDDAQAAVALQRAGTAFMLAGEFAAAAERLAESVDIWEGLGVESWEGLGQALGTLGEVQLFLSDVESARRSSFRALALAEREDTPRAWLARASLLCFLGGVCLMEKKPDESLALSQEALPVLEGLIARYGDPKDVLGTCLDNIGCALGDLGRPEEARPYFLRALEVLEGADEGQVRYGDRIAAVRAHMAQAESGRSPGGIGAVSAG